MILCRGSFIITFFTGRWRVNILHREDGGLKYLVEGLMYNICVIVIKECYLTP